ncbi:MAG: hypothetical protein VXY51_10535 [Pseudomonadota bacterium]|nr:hypothetical protein [Pseudomonadota bacterium]MEC8550009.1 hypothetical protein [Pseudomonadota bacterium]
MRVIIKIDEYLEDENYIVFRIARLNSHKKINDHRTFSVDCSDLDTTDTETFIDSLIFKYKHLIQEQDENQELLKENIPVNVDEELDLKSIVGKVIEGRAFDRSTRMLKMRRILL